MDSLQHVVAVDVVQVAIYTQIQILHCQNQINQQRLVVGNGNILTKQIDRVGVHCKGLLNGTQVTTQSGADHYIVCGQQRVVCILGSIHIIHRVDHDGVRIDGLQIQIGESFQRDNIQIAGVLVPQFHLTAAGNAKHVLRATDGYVGAVHIQNHIATGDNAVGFNLILQIVGLEDQVHRILDQHQILEIQSVNLFFGHPDVAFQNLQCFFDALHFVQNIDFRSAQIQQFQSVLGSGFGQLLCQVHHHLQIFAQNFNSVVDNSCLILEFRCSKEQIIQFLDQITVGFVGKDAAIGDLQMDAAIAGADNIFHDHIAVNFFQQDLAAGLDCDAGLAVDPDGIIATNSTTGLDYDSVAGNMDIGRVLGFQSTGNLNGNGSVAANGTKSDLHNICVLGLDFHYHIAFAADLAELVVKVAEKRIAKEALAFPDAVGQNHKIQIFLHDDLHNRRLQNLVGTDHRGIVGNLESAVGTAFIHQRTCTQNIYSVGIQSSTILQNQVTACHMDIDRTIGEVAAAVEDQVCIGIGMGYIQSSTGDSFRITALVDTVQLNRVLTSVRQIQVAAGCIVNHIVAASGHGIVLDVESTIGG